MNSVRHGIVTTTLRPATDIITFQSTIINIFNKRGLLCAGD